LKDPTGFITFIIYQNNSDGTGMVIRLPAETCQVFGLKEKPQGKTRLRLDIT